MSGNNEIQKLVVDSREPILCQICSHCVFDENIENPNLSPCTHTIFIATDDGLEHKTSILENNLKDLDISIDSDDWYESGGILQVLTEKLTIKGLIVIESYMPAPSGYGAYFGFAPEENTSDD